MGADICGQKFPNFEVSGERLPSFAGGLYKFSETGLNLAGVCVCGFFLKARIAKFLRTTVSFHPYIECTCHEKSVLSFAF